MRERFAGVNCITLASLAHGGIRTDRRRYPTVGRHTPDEWCYDPAWAECTGPTVADSMAGLTAHRQQ